MYSLFWRSIFSSLMVIFLFSNIAFAFNLIHLVNPTSVIPEGSLFSDYYFGVSSFVDSFKYYFGNNTALSGFTATIRDLGNIVGKAYNLYVKALNPQIFKKNPAYEIISAIIAIVMFMNSLVGMFLMFVYVLYYIIYLLFFGFTIVSYIFYWFGGGFATPLPSTDWYNSYQQYGYDWSNILDFWNNIFNTRANMV